MKNCNNCKNVGKTDKCFACVGVGNIETGECKPSMWEAITEDKVNHPPHYNHGKYECIDVMEDTFGKLAVKHFCILNAFKYIWRANEKNGIEDVKKAVWYLNKTVELEEKNHDQ